MGFDMSIANTLKITASKGYIYQTEIKIIINIYIDKTRHESWKVI